MPGKAGGCCVVCTSPEDGQASSTTVARPPLLSAPSGVLALFPWAPSVVGSPLLGVAPGATYMGPQPQAPWPACGYRVQASCLRGQGATCLSPTPTACPHTRHLASPATLCWECHRDRACSTGTTCFPSLTSTSQALLPTSPQPRQSLAAMSLGCSLWLPRDMPVGVMAALLALGPGL